MESTPLEPQELRLIDAYWRAANYVSVGQIYLLDNPLVREPLRPEHVKPRLLGHFGTAPGLNLVYAHLNRAIRSRDLSTIYVTGPGHGGPALVANAYLEGTYSEVYAALHRRREATAAEGKAAGVPSGKPAIAQTAFQARLLEARERWRARAISRPLPFPVGLPQRYDGICGC